MQSAFSDQTVPSVAMQSAFSDQTVPSVAMQSAFSDQTVPSVAMQSEFQWVELLQAQLWTFLRRIHFTQFFLKNEAYHKIFLCDVQRSVLQALAALYSLQLSLQPSPKHKIFPNFAYALNILTSYSWWFTLCTLQQAYQQKQWIIQNLFQRLF